MKGYAGKGLKVDLSTGRFDEWRIPERFQALYLGGLGFASRLLYDEVKYADPFSPDNKLIVAPGLLVGTGVPTASKTTFAAKSPLTGGFGRSVAGARLGVELKKAGYDVLTIEGRCLKPSILLIQDGEVEVWEAGDLWGLDVRETASRIRKRVADAATAVIGPAGENLCKIAGIDCEERQAARTGLGAVMGSKRLKAIAVKGSGRIEYADPEKLRGLTAKWTKILKENPNSELDMKYGTAEFYEWMNVEKGTFPSRNWQHGYFQKSFDKLKQGEKSPLDPYYWSPKYTVKNRACPNCTKPCGRVFRVPSGPYMGVELDGLEYETIYSLGGCLEVEDPEAVAKLHLTCDLLGLDAISAGLTVAWAMEAYEKGLIDPGPGLNLSFGNVDAALTVLEMMAAKEGELGSLLADGVKAASEKLGKRSWEFAVHVKGLELPAYDVRAIKGMALAVAVSTRGACHLTAGIYGTELVGKWWRFSGVDRFSAEGKGYEVKIHEDLMTLYDMLGVCKFSRHMFYVEGFPEIVSAVTGLDTSISHLLTAGERVYNVQRCFNAREGFSRVDDTLPPRVLSQPIPKGPSKGSFVKRKELERMLDDYYQARGWSENGVPTKVKLVSLDLEDLADELGSDH